MQYAVLVRRKLHTAAKETLLPRRAWNFQADKKAACSALSTVADANSNKRCTKVGRNWVG